MFWAALFIIGLLGILAGVIPIILNGPRLGPVIVAIIGIGLFGTGAAGVVVRPGFLALKLPRIVFGDSDASTPVADASPRPAVTVAEAPEPAGTASAPASTAADKDESQLEPKLPQPVSVTTTTVVSHEVDPLADPTAASAAQPALPVPVAPPMPPTPTPEQVEAQKLAELTPQQPKDEATFTQILVAARVEYNQADDVGRDTAQSSRATAICKALPKPDIKSWVGAIKEIDRDPGGRTILSVSLPDGSLVKTWNNAMSDTDDRTLIAAGTPLAATVAPLKPGDAIRFSGNFFTDEPDCYRSSRLSLDQSMTDPSFLFRFTNIEKI